MMQIREAYLSELEVFGGFRQKFSKLSIVPQMNIQKKRSIVTFLSNGTHTLSLSSAVKYIWLRSVLLCISHSP